MRQRTWMVIAAALLLTGIGLGVVLQRVVFSPGPPAKDAFHGTALVAAFFPEGPCFRDGRLLYVDYSSHCLMSWDGQNATRLWHRDKTGPSGLIALKDDTLLVACYDEGTLVHLDTSGKELSATKDPDGNPFNGPNDFAMDLAGGVYFSTSGEWAEKAAPEGKVYYRSPAGEISRVAKGIHYANGLAVVRGGERLLVAETMKSRVLQYTIGKGGSLAGPTVWKQLAAPRDADWSTGPDGLKTDSEGNVYICHFGASRILVTQPDGTLLRNFRVPLKGVTNVALAPGEKTLYVTAVKDAKEPYLGAVYEIPNE
jgi:gluconolactonase